MEWASLIVSVAGAVISIWAIINAKNAVEVANKAIRAKNNQEDNARLRSLIPKLTSAKDVCKRNTVGANPSANQGRSKEQDLDILSEAVDGLRTGLPIDWNESQRERPQKASDEIEKCIDTINQQNNQRDGWKDALASLQTIIPWLEQQERLSGDDLIRNPVR